jgi:hypothetical protein
MSFVQHGEKVRIYYEAYCFDEGEVVGIDAHFITVDFWDWKERWHDSDFTLQDLFLEGIEVLVPVRRGVIVLDYRDL